MFLETAIDDIEYKELLEAIRLEYGYDFTGYAESTMKRRITSFVEARKITSLHRLGEILLHDEPVFVEFLHHMSITVTEMFRDPEFYQHLRHIVIKHLATYPVLKIWIAGCATGQEVYSVAIVLEEEGLLDRAIIYATDINQRSLHIAEQGIYPLDIMKGYTKNYLMAGGKREFSRYYTADHNFVLFDRRLRQNVVFSVHNLVTDQSFNEFQLILCRNVLMYFNPGLQHHVVDLFYQSLCPFGFLGLGDKESLLFSDKKDRFAETSRKEKIFRKVK